MKFLSDSDKSSPWINGGYPMSCDQVIRSYMVPRSKQWASEVSLLTGSRTRKIEAIPPIVSWYYIMLIDDKNHFYFHFNFKFPYLKQYHLERYSNNNHSCLVYLVGHGCPIKCVVYSSLNIHLSARTKIRRLREITF